MSDLHDYEALEGAMDPGAAPDVGEALAQMNQRLDAMSERQLAGDDESAFGDPGIDYGLDELEREGGDFHDTADDLSGQLDGLVEERVRAQMEPYIVHQEIARREQAILDLADQYPRLREPEILDAVAGEMQEMAQAYGVPAMATDPRLMLRIYQSYEAAKSAEKAGAVQSPEGAVLETGAGPGAAETQVSPEEAAYLGAIHSRSGGSDAFS